MNEVGRSIVSAHRACQRKRRANCTVITVLLTVLLPVAAMAELDPPQRDPSSQKSAEQERAVALARHAVAARLKVSIDTITLRSATRTEWRDSSLGCPEAGQRYLPRLIAGYRVLLEEGERRHVVHVGGGRAVMCGGADGTAKVSTRTGLVPAAAAADAVRAALATRLGIPEAEVRIDSVRPARTAAAPCLAIPAVASAAGHIVDARAAGTAYRYYAGEGVATSCD